MLPSFCTFASSSLTFDRCRSTGVRLVATAKCDGMILEWRAVGTNAWPVGKLKAILTNTRRVVRKENFCIMFRWGWCQRHFGKVNTRIWFHVLYRQQASGIKSVHKTGTSTVGPHSYYIPVRYYVQQRDKDVRAYVDRISRMRWRRVFPCIFCLDSFFFQHSQSIVLRAPQTANPKLLMCVEISPKSTRKNNEKL